MKAVILIAVVFAAMTIRGLACSCGPTPTVPDAFTSANTVFAGRCIEGKLLSRTAEGITFEIREFTFEIDQTWKGAPATKRLVVETGLGDGDCGYPFEVGFSYVVYAYAVEKRLVTNHCTRTVFTGTLPNVTGSLTAEMRPEIDALDKAAGRQKRKWPEPPAIPGLVPIP
jgi:hypothetical protein